MRLVTTYDVALANSSLFLYVESASFAGVLLHRRRPGDVPPAADDRAGHAPRSPGRPGRLLPRRRGGRRREVCRRARRPAEEALQQPDVRERHEVGRDRAQPRGTSPSRTRTSRSRSPRRTACACAATRCCGTSRSRRGSSTTRSPARPCCPRRPTTTLLLQRLENHIRGVVPHFGDKVYAWDVVNEVIDESQPDCMRRSTWFNVTGTGLPRHGLPGRARGGAAGHAALHQRLQLDHPEQAAVPLRRGDGDARPAACPWTASGHQMHDNVEFPSAPEHGRHPRPVRRPGRDAARHRDGRQHLLGQLQHADRELRRDPGRALPPAGAALPRLLPRLQGAQASSSPRSRSGAWRTTSPG